MKQLIFAILTLLVFALAISAFFYVKPQPVVEEEDLGTFVTLVTDSSGAWNSIRDVSRANPIPILPEFDGRVVDYAAHDRGEVLIYDDNGIHVVQVRTHGADDWFVISRSPFEKEDAVLSQDGNYVAYTELVDSTDPTNPSSWEVYFFDRTTGDLFLADQGFGPHFLTFTAEDGTEWESLVFNAPDGIANVHTIAREEDGLLVQKNEAYVPTSTTDALRFSSQNVPGKTVAIYFNTILNGYDVFTVPEQYFDLEFVEIFTGNDVVGVLGNSLFIVDGDGLYAHQVRGIGEPQFIRNIEVSGTERITKIVMSNYDK